MSKMKHQNETKECVNVVERIRDVMERKGDLTMGTYFRGRRDWI